MTGPWLIRQAQMGDAAGMARVHVLSWQQAYRGLLPQAMLDNLSIETRTRQWGEWIAAPADHHNLVALVDQQVVGFVSCGPVRGDFAGFDCEVAAIYLLPDAQGQGLGRALFEQATQFLHSQGFVRMLVWVLKSNLGAQAFYQRLGGQPQLEQRVVIGSSMGLEPLEVDELGFGFDLAGRPC